MKTKYAFQGMKENMARAISKDLGISTKVSIELANFLRGRNSREAKVILERIIKKKQAVPFKRFTDGVGHRKGANIAAGRFPHKASEAFLKLIKQCEANAQIKGLSDELRIVHLVAQKGTNMFRQGRQRRRQYKRTHLEIVLEEVEAEKKQKEKKTVKKTTLLKTEPKVKEKKQDVTDVKDSKTDVKKESKTEKEAPKTQESKKETAPKEDSKSQEEKSKKQTSEEQK